MSCSWFTKFSETVLGNLKFSHAMTYKADTILDFVDDTFYQLQRVKMGVWDKSTHIKYAWNRVDSSILERARVWSVTSKI